MIDAKLTKHGRKRLRKRLGLSKGSCVEKNASMALENGIRPKELTGRLRRYMDAMARRYGSQPVLYNGYVYAFKESDVLITCFPVHRDFRKLASAVLAK